MFVTVEQEGRVDSTLLCASEEKSKPQPDNREWHTLSSVVYSGITYYAPSSKSLYYDFKTFLQVK